MWPKEEKDELIEITKSIVEKHFLSYGNIVEPVIVYRKDGVIQEPILICLPDEVLDQSGITSLVAEAYTEFVYAISPDEVTITRQGFFVGDGSERDCLSVIYSTREKDRTFLTPVFGNEIGEWQEVEVESGDLYQVFEKSVHRRN